MRKIKHFAGYGCVQAGVITKKFNTLTGLNTIVVRVQGNHEYGLERTDKYDVFNWLLKRFVKNLDPNFDCYRDIVSVEYNNIHGVKDASGYYLDTAEYTIVYR